MNQQDAEKWLKDNGLERSLLFWLDPARGIAINVAPDLLALTQRK